MTLATPNRKEGPIPATTGDRASNPQKLPSRWTIYEGYQRIGEVRGTTTGGPAGGAALLLLIG